MPEIITCPDCRRRLVLPDGLHGQSIQCPSCKARFQAAGPPPTIPAEVLEVLPLSPAPPPAVPALPPAAPVPSARETWIDWDKPAADPLRFDTSTPVRKKPRRWGPGTIVIGAFLILFLVGFLSGLRNDLFRKKDILDDPEARRLEAMQAFRNPPVQGEMADSLKVLFDDLGAALRARDANRIVGHFDPDRMFDELLGQGLLPPRFRNERAGFVSGIQIGLRTSMLKQAPLLDWTAFEVRSIKNLADDEIVVIARHRDQDRHSLKMRWWLKWRGNAWRIYDFEDLDMGVRASTLMGSVVAMQDGEIRALAQAVQTLQEALLAIAVQQDANTAEKKLKQVARARFPPALDALRQLAQALVHIARGENEEALKSLDLAGQLQPDMPALDMMKGTVYNQLSQWEQAVTHLQTYQKLLGDDANLCFQLGLAQHNLKRYAEARENYRKSLDDDPEQAEALEYLIRALGPGDERDDLGPRFTKLGNHRQHFPGLADECRQYQDFESLEPICLAMQKIDPQYAPADFNLAVVRVWQGKTDQALVHFKAALAKEPDNRRGMVQDLAKVLVQAGKGAEAYALLPEPREAFACLLPELIKGHRTDDLRKLVATHTTKHKNDPLVPFARGELLVQEGLFHLADQAFVAGMAKPPEAATLELFRNSRVSARYYNGKALEAYAEIGTPDETFQELANLAFFDDNDALLEKLIAAHARKRPDSPVLQNFRCRLKIRQGKPAEAVALFKAGLNKVGDDDRQDFLRDFCEDMAEAGFALEAYPAVPDPVQGFQILGNHLLERGRDETLSRLMEAHGKGHADDPWLVFFRGDLQARQKAWDQAAATLRPLLVTAPEELIYRVRYRYMEAMYQTGQALPAYRAANEAWRAQVFQLLAQPMIRDKKGAELLALVEAHRPHGKDDPEFLLAEARGRILLGRYAGAATLIKEAHEKAIQEHQRRRIIRDYLMAMVDCNRPMQGYRSAPDRALAFETLANWLVQKKQPKELAELLDEHGKEHIEDPLFLNFRGELYSLQGDAKQAEQVFLAGLAQAKPEHQYRLRNGLFRARVKLGKTTDTYRDFGPEYFETLAHACINEKNVNQLRALLTARRQAQPDDPHLPAWDLELRYLKGDHEGALKLLDDQRQGLFALPRYRWKAENYRVRTLVKLKRFPEAIQEAERLDTQRRGDQLLVVLAHASAGDPKLAMAAVQKVGAQPWLIRRCYEDDDLGPLIQGGAFQEFRAKYPKPELDFDDRDDRD